MLFPISAGFWGESVCPEFADPSLVTPTMAAQRHRQKQHSDELVDYYIMKEDHHLAALLVI